MIPFRYNKLCLWHTRNLLNCIHVWLKRIMMLDKWKGFDCFIIFSLLVLFQSHVPEWWKKSLKLAHKWKLYNSQSACFFNSLSFHSPIHFKAFFCSRKDIQTTIYPSAENALHKCNYECSSLVLAFRESFNVLTPAEQLSSSSIPQFTSSPLNIKKVFLLLVSAFMSLSRGKKTSENVLMEIDICAHSLARVRRLFCSKFSLIIHLAFSTFYFKSSQCLLNAHLTRKVFRSLLTRGAFLQTKGSWWIHRVNWQMNKPKYRLFSFFLLLRLSECRFSRVMR